jgi:ABC-2 type transport system permease protein
VNSGYFDLVGEVYSPRAIDTLLDKDDARGVLVIPSNFGSDVTSGRHASVQFLVNGRQRQYRDDCRRLCDGPDQRRVAAIRAASTHRLHDGADAQRRAACLVQPELRSTLFLVPGLIAYIAMLTAVVSTALSIVREKEAGTMEQVRMSPIGPVPYVLGKTAPYFVVSLISSMSIVVAAILLFDMPMRGSWVVLVGIVSLFLVGALAFGLLISSIADSQQVAFQLALLTSFLPTLMLSGFIFPISSMPTFSSSSRASSRHATSSSRCEGSCSRAWVRRISGRTWWPSSSTPSRFLDWPLCGSGGSGLKKHC